MEITKKIYGTLFHQSKGLNTILKQEQFKKEFKKRYDFKCRIGMKANGLQKFRRLQNPK